MKKLAVIIPAYNESTTIERTINSIVSKLDLFKENLLELNIIVINDGSTDDTKNVLSKLSLDYVVTHKTNKGLGAAVRSGLIKAKEIDADICVKFDADLQHNPLNIIDVCLPIINDQAEIVYGHRFKNIKYRMPFVRRVGNLTFTKLMSFLTGWPLKDSQPGIFAVDKEFLSDIYLPGTYNYTQQILINAYHRGFRFKHVDVEFHKRNTGSSFISYKYPFKVLPQILMVIVGVKPLRLFGPLALSFLTISLAVALYDLFLYSFYGADKIVEHVNAVMGFGLFGLQTLFFGLLAQLIVEKNR